MEKIKEEKVNLVKGAAARRKAHLARVQKKKDSDPESSETEEGSEEEQEEEEEGEEVEE